MNQSQIPHNSIIRSLPDLTKTITAQTVSFSYTSCLNKYNMFCTNKITQVSAKRMKLRVQYEIEYKEDCEKIKNAFEKKRGREIVEDYRDEIRDWFRQW